MSNNPRASHWSVAQVDESLGHAAPDAGVVGWIGKRVRRREDPALITGQGRYAADPAPPRLVHLAFRRALVPRATALKVRLNDARNRPGVVGAWKAGDLKLAVDYMPDSPPFVESIRRPLLAFEEVRQEGDAVAVVAADTEYQAHDAVDAVEVEFSELTQDTSDLESRAFSYGDVNGAFEDPAVCIREQLRMGPICGAAMEPRAVLAEWNGVAHQLVIRATVGWVQSLRDCVAGCLGLDASQVVAITDDVGGSFGAKNSPYPEYVVAAAIARHLDRPVRWVASRTEDGITTGQSHSVDFDLELAADKDGRLRGLRGRACWPVGAYVGRGMGQARNFATHAVSAYVLPAMALDVASRYSSSPPVATIRGGSRPVGNFAIERMMDRLARQLDIDPIEVRRRNLVAAGQMPYKTGFGAVYDGGDYRRLLDTAVNQVNISELRNRQRGGEPVGVGIALCVESTGVGGDEPSRITVHPDGTAEVRIATTPQGQGHHTFVSQVVADRLGWPIELVRVQSGDSRDFVKATVTAGSRSALEAGNSTALSAAAARRALLARASELLEAAVDDLLLSPSGATIRGAPSRGVSLAEMVGSGLEVSESWQPAGTTAWASSCHLAVVRIDEETGTVSVIRYVIAHDSGRTINPLTLEGQLHGGYAHGIGYALFEEASYSPEGNLISASLLDYSIVGAPDIGCDPELVHCETHSTQNPEGFRGVGEAGTIAVPATIANAIEDAVHATGRTGRINQIPVTPERLWQILNGGQERNSASPTGTTSDES